MFTHSPQKQITVEFIKLARSKVYMSLILCCYLDDPQLSKITLFNSLQIKRIKCLFYDYCSIFLRLWLCIIFVSITSCTRLLGQSVLVQTASQGGPDLNLPGPSSLSRLVICCQVQGEPRAYVPGLNQGWPMTCWGIWPSIVGTDGSPEGVRWEGRWVGTALVWSLCSHPDSGSPGALES